MLGVREQFTGTLSTQNLPHIVIDTAEGADWDFIMYLAGGYWQVEIHPCDKVKTGFGPLRGLS